MEEFQEKNLIVYLNKKTFQLDDIEALIALVLGNNYCNLNKEEKLFKRYESLLPFSIENELLIVYSSKGVIESNNLFNNTKYDISKDLFVDDEIAYFLSLCRLNQIQILEKRDANIFAFNINKQEFTF